jgi:hypothetical protein
MLVHGREVKFFRSVGAVNEIAKACPGGDISKLTDQLQSNNTIVVNDTWATFISALSNGFEMAQKYEDPAYKPNPLTVAELYTLTEEDFYKLIGEASEAWFGDKRLVEVEESKGKKNETSETSD